MKKIIDQTEINTIKSRLYFKIFNIITKDNNIYYLDNDFKLIWNDKQEIVGIINNNNNVFFNDIDLLLNI